MLIFSSKLLFLKSRFLPLLLSLKLTDVKIESHEVKFKLTQYSILGGGDINPKSPRLGCAGSSSSESEASVYSLPSSSSVYSSSSSSGSKVSDGGGGGGGAT